MSYLKVQIVEQDRKERTIRAQLHDATPFTFKVPFWDVYDSTETEDGLPVGWLKVEEMGRRQDIISIRLPAPVLEYGCNVNVSATRFRTNILPRKK